MELMDTKPFTRVYLFLSKPLTSTSIPQRSRSRSLREAIDLLRLSWTSMETLELRIDAPNSYLI